jgi:hypothetical protein
VNSLTAEGACALTLAVRSGSAACVSVLLRAPGVLIGAPHCAQDLPLAAACAADRPRLVKLLVAARAPVNDVSTSGQVRGLHDCRVWLACMTVLVHGLAVR